jgi:carbamoyltransferase
MVTKPERNTILGIKYGGNDTAAALMVNGEIVAACEQERYTLDKHSRKFPQDAIMDCLAIAGIDMEDVDELAFVNDPIRMVREIYLRPALANKQRIGFMLDDIERIREYWNMEDVVRKQTRFTGPIDFYLHHLCHAASAFYPSGFEESLILSIDGMGEHESGILAKGTNKGITILNNENKYPHSLGLAYSAVTNYLGWLHHSDEGIIMGLAAYGDPHAPLTNDGKSYVEIFREIIQVTGHYTYTINNDWLDYYTIRNKWVTDKFLQTFGPKRETTEPIESRHQNIAAALQLRLEEIVLSQLKNAREEFGISRLCLAGGVALNCKMNGEVEQSRLFDEIFVQPAAGDNGCAIGACYLAAAKNVPLCLKQRHNHYLGSRFTEPEIEVALNTPEVYYTKPDNIYLTTAELIAQGKIVGWFQGASEFGPRALGNRSILCRPFPGDMKDHLNKMVKFREPFRPFAPAVLLEDTSLYFTIRQESPHMLIACKAQREKNDEIPAVVHVDGTCRVQTVSRDSNARFYNLLRAFKDISGCSVLLNTSFNIKGQPIVNTPQQAVECFLSTRIDYLVLGNYLVQKKSSEFISK